MQNPLTEKLERIAALTDTEKQALEGAVARTRDLPPGVDLIQAGEQPTNCTFLLEGWACRYKLLPEGKRQITGFVIPGDPCDLDGLVMGLMDHSVSTLTAAKVALIPRDLLLGLMHSHPTIARALWQETLAEAAIAREWVVNVGARPAYARIAHVLCEMGLRLQAAGLGDNSRFEFLVTQADLADATGMTNVHVNRTLQEMRSDGLVSWTGSEVVIPDWEQLQKAGTFSPDYLFINPGDRNTGIQPSVS
jgi:CRP-like cAMP-binding protein